MENEWKQLTRYFPKRVTAALGKTELEDVREIRLRRGRPLTLSTSGGECYLAANGKRLAKAEPSALFLYEEDLEETVLRLCGYAVHTHQEELRNGYVTTETGLRVGVGGTVTVSDGKPLSVHSVTSLCFRISRLHSDRSAPLCRLLTADGTPSSMLLCGQPSSGKTTLLRDIARRLSEGADGRRWRVAVVDERGELSFGDVLGDCDVIRGCPKPEGIRRALRLLAPDVIVFDEWATEEETAAVADVLPCGVAVITSCHAASLQALGRRRLLLPAVQGGFEWLVELVGSHRPGEWKRTERVSEFFAENLRDIVIGADLPFDRQPIGGDRAGTGRTMGTDGAPVVASVRPSVVHGTADPAVIEGTVPKRNLSCSPVFAGGDRRSARELEECLAEVGRSSAAEAGMPATAGRLCRSVGTDRGGWTNGTLPTVCETV